MTAPASIPALIAEGRRLIAQATPGPWHYGPSRNCPGSFYIGQPAHCVTLAHVHNFPDGQREANARIIVFAVNNLAALLDVAEAAAAMNMSRLVGEHWCADPCATCDHIAALDSALSKLRGVR